MTSGKSRNWMWADAVDLLNKVQRLHQQSFAPGRPRGGMVQWEPPVDILETDRALLVFVALPGVDIGRTEAGIEDGMLVISGHRTLPAELRTARIHRLELPQGRFERRLELPTGRYSGVGLSIDNGCLLVTLRKADNGRNQP